MSFCFLNIDFSPTKRTMKHQKSCRRTSRKTPIVPKPFVINSKDLKISINLFEPILMLKTPDSNITH